MDTVLLAFEIIGTAAFAVSGAFTAVRRDMDVFGVIILGLTTAVGGGIIRDLILGITPPRTFLHPIYATIAISASIIVFLIARRGFTEAARSGRFSETSTEAQRSARNAAKRRTFPLFTARASISRGGRRAPARAVNSRRIARPAKREKIVFPRMQAVFCS